MRSCVDVRESTWFVLVGQASIEGPEELYIKSGDDLALTCTFNVHATPSRAVLWYHGGTAVDPNSPRGGISLETEKLDEGIRSKLQVTEVSPRDSGNYTCVPSNAKPATVVVHITYGWYKWNDWWFHENCYMFHLEPHCLNNTKIFIKSELNNRSLITQFTLIQKKVIKLIEDSASSS